MIDYEWALDRVRRLQACHEINAGVLGVRLLKGHGYPNDAMSDAQDALALKIVLAALPAAPSQEEAPNTIGCVDMIERLGMVAANLRALEQHELAEYIDDAAGLLSQPPSIAFPTLCASDELLAALKAVAETADDCPVCDRGRLRNPEKTHWPECPFGRAQAVIAKTECKLSALPAAPSQDSLLNADGSTDDFLGWVKRSRAND